MLLMAKKPTRGRPSKSDAGGKTPSTTLRLDPEILAALEKYISQQRYKTSKTDVIEVALQELFQREGFWPPETDKKTEAK